ncbi:MAG: hypothetical protein JWQ98_3018 [Chlorobi bacterium]|nr:hypothetical protein [Chlorobiota bacterium]
MAGRGSILLMALALGACAGRATPADMPRLSPDAPPIVKTGAAAAAPVAVVELFTSEGCSSCPPADRLLSAITDEARQDGRRIFPLSFHVDYWNKLGWRDPFSDAAYSSRQNDYVRALGIDGAYTPQMIVNGRAEFIGSDATTARARIADALAMPVEAEIRLNATLDTAAKTVTVRYEVTGARPGEALNLALTERDLNVEVARGENGGRKLHHDNVVRAFATIRIGEDGHGTAMLPAGALEQPGKSAVVAYVQNPETMRITGGGMTGLAK